MSNIKELRAKLDLMIAGLKLDKAERAKVISELDLDPNRRSVNLQLLRSYFFDGQQQMATLLGVSQTKVSQWERGDKLIENRDCQKIEKSIGLPPDWFDRDNGKNLFLSNDEIRLLRQLKTLPDGSMKDLLSFLKSLNPATGAE